MREWRALGVTPVGRRLRDTELATLLEPDGPGATAYLLTTNYRTILDYNCSNFYALSVGLLADAIVGAEPLAAAASRGDRQRQPIHRFRESIQPMTRAILLAASAACCLASAAPAAAPPFETPAPVAYLVDLSSGAVLLAKDADRRIPPASMAKMMTTHLAFDLIERGELTLDKMCTVRPETWQQVARARGRLDHVPVAGRAGQRRESAPRHRHPVGQRRHRRARRVHRRDRAGLRRADERAGASSSA